MSLHSAVCMYEILKELKGKNKNMENLLPLNKRDKPL